MQKTKSRIASIVSALFLFGALSLLAGHAVAADSPAVFLPNVSDVTKNSATFSGQYTPTDQDFSAYFEYKKEGSAAYTKTPDILATGGGFSTGVTGLTPSSNYLFHSVVIGADNKPVLSDDVSFTTQANPTASPSPNPNPNPSTPTPNPTTPNPTPTTPSGSNTISDTDKLSNPLASANTVPEFIALIIGIVWKIALPILVIMFIWTGFLFVQAQGNEHLLGQAKTTLLWTVIGAALVLGAWTLATAINGTINQLK